MRNYLQITRELLEHGSVRETRNGMVRSLFHRTLHYDLTDGFPIVTTKFVPFKHVAAELFWFLSGKTNIKPLQDQGVTIWDEWADEKGEVGPLYGVQMRDITAVTSDYEVYSIDQVRNVIASLRDDPYGRRHLWTTWNPAEIPEMALPPCHGIAVQFYVENDYLSCAMYQRSADWFLGVPFNISSYALLTHLMAREVGLFAGRLHLTFGDLHLYENHVEQAILQLQRKPHKLPELVFESNAVGRSIFELTKNDVWLWPYEHEPTIKAPVSK